MVWASHQAGVPVLIPSPKLYRMRVVTTLKGGQPAPDFELPSIEGRPISLREFRGREVRHPPHYPMSYACLIVAECARGNTAEAERQLKLLAATLPGFESDTLARPFDILPAPLRWRSALRAAPRPSPELGDAPHELLGLAPVLLRHPFVERLLARAFGLNATKYRLPTHLP
jgi:hypothetical protein